MNERQRRFCEYFASSGSATEAAKAAGYSEKSAYSIGAENLRKPEICEYIRQLQEKSAGERIADMEEVKAAWTKILRNESEKTANRLRAGELLARAAGAFLHFQPDPDGSGIIAAGETDSGSDVIIYVPQMLREEDCMVKEEGEDGHGSNNTMG